MQSLSRALSAGNELREKLRAILEQYPQYLSEAQMEEVQQKVERIVPQGRYAAKNGELPVYVERVSFRKGILRHIELLCVSYHEMNERKAQEGAAKTQVLSVVEFAERYHHHPHGLDWASL